MCFHLLFFIQIVCFSSQFERVRVIYKYALDKIPKHEAQELFKNYTMFEKKFGDRRGIEDVIISKRRFQYEEEVKVKVSHGQERKYGDQKGIALSPSTLQKHHGTPSFYSFDLLFPLTHCNCLWKLGQNQQQADDRVWPKQPV